MRTKWLAVLVILAGCESTEPASVVKGTWSGPLYGQDISLTMDEHGGVVTGRANWGDAHDMVISDGALDGRNVQMWMMHPAYDSTEISVSLEDGDSTMFGTARFRAVVPVVRLIELKRR